MSSLGGLGLSYGAEAAVSRLREAAGLGETGLFPKAGLEVSISIVRSLEFGARENLTHFCKAAWVH